LQQLPRNIVRFKNYGHAQMGNITTFLPDHFKNLIRPYYYWLKRHVRKSFKSSIVALPSHLNMAFTMKCQAACPHCYFLQENTATFKRPELLTQKFLTNMLGSPFCKNIRTMTCGGGEALLHPDILSLVKIPYQFGITQIQIVSNGITLQDKDIVQRIIANKSFNTLQVSLDAANADDFMLKKGITKCDFNSILKNIAAITASYEKGGHFSTGLSFVINARNIRDLSQMIKLAEELNVDYCHFATQQVTRDDNSSTIGQTVEKEQPEYDNVLRQTSYQVDINIQPPLQSNFLHYFCASLAHHLSLSPEGRLAPCCHIPWDKKYGMFDSCRENPINNPAAVNLRDMFIAAKKEGNPVLLPQECKKCPRRLKGYFHFSRHRRKWQFIPY